ncbi:MAG: hypothetical protein ABIR13_04755 [Polaromonas sp.]
MNEMLAAKGMRFPIDIIFDLAPTQQGIRFSGARSLKIGRTPQDQFRISANKGRVGAAALDENALDLIGVVAEFGKNRTVRIGLSS